MVEDNPTVREVAARTLRRRGYTILEATNGQQALDQAGEYEGEIHLLLADVVMPHWAAKNWSI